MTAVVAVIKICRDRFPRLPTSTQPLVLAKEGGSRMEDVGGRCATAAPLFLVSAAAHLVYARSRSYTYTSARGEATRQPTYLPTYVILPG